MNKNKYIKLFLGFFLIFAWGVYSTGWYESAQLLVQGTAERGKADLALRWDSGAGLNEYESRHVLVNIPRLTESEQQHVRIRALQEKHPDSESSTVSILKIILDGKEFDLTNVRPRSIFHDRLAIQLTAEQSVFEFDAPVKEHIRIVFANSYYFGRVAVEVNGVVSRHDLYTSSGRYDEKAYDYHLLQPDGSFQFSIDLPRYQVKRLYLQNKDPERPVHFSTISVCHENSCKRLEPDRQASVNQVFFRKPNQSFKRFFDPVRIWFQGVFALFSVGLLWQLINLINASKGVRQFFLHRERRYFWGIAFLFAVVNGIVLLPFWPGIMSQDSLMIWRASGIPEVYLNDHPVLNQLFYMYLRTIWNNPAVVPVVQIVATALLVAFAFNKMRRAGVASALLLPFYLLILFALPLHLYNIVLWKDIPYALMVTVWGFFFVFTYSRKDANRWRFSVRQWGGLLLAYLALCFFRHNGLVYLVVVPFFWLLLGPYAWRKGLGYFFFSLLVAAGLLWTMSHIRTFGGLSFLSTSLQQHTMFLQQTTLPREAMRVGSGFFQVFDMGKEKTVSDKWHYYLEDRYSWNYLQQTGLSDYYPYVDRKPYFPKLRQAILEVYRASYEKPWQYFLWNPFHMLIFVPFVLLGFRWFPSAAIFSGFLLCGVIPLLVINIFNWRYYYFFYFGLYFILPLMFFDILRKRGEGH